MLVVRTVRVVVERGDVLEEARTSGWWLIVEERIGLAHQEIMAHVDSIHTALRIVATAAVLVVPVPAGARHVGVLVLSIHASGVDAVWVVAAVRDLFHAWTQISMTDEKDE